MSIIFQLVHRSTFALLSICAFAAVSGCATNTSDPCAHNPSQDHIGGAVVGVLGGSYTACENQLRDQIAHANIRADELKLKAGRLEQRATELQGEERAAVLRLAATNRSVDDAISRLNTLRAQRTEDQARLATLRRQEEQLSRRLIAASDPNRDVRADIASLEQEEEALLREIDAVEAALSESL